MLFAPKPRLCRTDDLTECVTPKMMVAAMVLLLVLLVISTDDEDCVDSDAACVGGTNDTDSCICTYHKHPDSS